MTVRKLLVTLAALLLAARPAVGVKVDGPGEAEERSSHIVSGTVTGIYSKVRRDTQYEYTYCVAEMRVEGIEKGDGIKPRDLIYVRYLGAMRWISKEPSQPGPAGHDNTPTEGEKRRVCLVRNADGGWDVYYVSGFRPITEKKF